MASPPPESAPSAEKNSKQIDKLCIKAHLKNDIYLRQYFDDDAEWTEMYVYNLLYLHMINPIISPVIIVKLQHEYKYTNELY